MNCKKKLLWVAPIALLAALSSCGEKASSYATTSLAAPMGISRSGESFSWYAVDGAAGYVAELDGGEPYGIAVVTQESEYAGKRCIYDIPVDEIADGKHKIRFASRNDADELSAWSKAYTFTVENEIDLDRPALSSSLYVQCDDYFDSVTYTFNDSIVASLDLGENRTSYSPTAKELGLDSLLEDKTTYVVTCKVSYEGVSSESSNPITYTYSKDRYVAAETPKVDEDKFVFEEKIYNPVFTVKFDSKEYVVDYSGNSSGYDEIKVTVLLNSLISHEYIEYYDLLKAKSHTIALKVNYDVDHYLPSSYSSSLTWETTDTDENLFASLCSNYSASFSDDYSKLTIGYSSVQIGCEFLTITASDQSGKSLSVAKGDDYEEMAIVSVGSAKIVKLTLSYSRLGYTASKTLSFTVPQTSATFNYNVLAGTNGLTWSVSGSKSGDRYEVVVTSGSSTKTYKTSSASLSYEEIELEGKLTFTVYTYRDGARIASSKSDAVTFSRATAPGSFSLDSDCCITLGEGMKAYLYYNNSSYYTRTYSSTSTSNNLISIGDYKRIEVCYMGDGYSSINSKKSVYYIDAVSNLRYSLLDGGYLSLADYNISNLVPSAYRNSEYLVSKNNATVFDMAKYREKSGDAYISLNGSSSSTLTKDAVTSLISDTISFSYGPRVSSINIASQVATFTPYSDYDGSYDIKIDKYDTTLSTYVACVALKTISTNTYSLSSLEAGDYKLYVRTHGNGYVLPGDYRTYTFDM